MRSKRNYFERLEARGGGGGEGGGGGGSVGGRDATEYEENHRTWTEKKV